MTDTDDHMGAPGAGPLSGITVLELGSMYAAPTTGRMLRDFGARLIKVEDPVSGDFARHWVPQKNGHSLGFTRLNAGKESVGIDLRTAHGQDLVRQFATKVDVIVESFRPGRLEEWGLGYPELREVNPRIILTRVSGFGQTGPYSARPGFGTVAETMSGYAFINGWPDTPPTSPPFGFADSIAGIAAAYGTSMSLYQRERAGYGECVDVALYEPLMFILGDIILRYTAKGEIQQREGNTSGAASPRGIYQAGDGHWLSIAASSQRIAERLFGAMGQPEMNDDPRFRTNADRLANNDEVQRRVRGWVGSMPRDEVLATLKKHEVVSAPVSDARDVSEDPHFNERSLVDFASEALGPVKMPGPVLHLDGYAGPDYSAVPAIGEHTDDVLADVLDMGSAEIADYRDRGIVGSPPA